MLSLLAFSSISVSFCIKVSTRYYLRICVPEVGIKTSINIGAINMQRLNRSEVL